MTELQEPRFRSRRYILLERDLEDLVCSLAELSGWSMVAELPADERENIARTVIFEISPGLTLGYYDDEFTESSCVIVHSVRDEAEMRVVETILKQDLDFWDDSSLLAAVSESEPGTRTNILSLLRLGLGAPRNFDQRYFDQLSASAQSVDPAVRIAALHGITYTEWRQFRPIVEHAVDDPDKSVRELASKVFSVFDRLVEDSP